MSQKSFCPKCHHINSKKDVELRITEGLYNDDSGHKINNIYTKQYGTLSCM